MLSKFARILNFDDSLIEQKNLITKFQPEITDLKKIGPAVRLWLNQKARQEIKNNLNPRLKNAITFLGSGDFHHISGFLVEQFSQPISVVVFDNHPDWDILPPHLGCGSWVSYLLKKPNIKNVIILGVTSNDISSASIHTGNLKALENNRVQIYPYAHRPTRVFFLKGLFSRVIHWQELKDRNLREFLQSVIDKLEAKQVYVSIDKDCLKPQYALTNWEEGCFELEELLSLIRVIKENLEIVGLDITGEYSFPEINGWVKKICSDWDHPGNYSAKDKTLELINNVNETTNMRILEELILA